MYLSMKCYYGCGLWEGAWPVRCDWWQSGEEASCAIMKRTRHEGVTPDQVDAVQSTYLPYQCCASIAWRLAGHHPCLRDSAGLCGPASPKHKQGRQRLLAQCLPTYLRTHNTQGHTHPTKCGLNARKLRKRSCGAGGGSATPVAHTHAGGLEGSWGWPGGSACRAGGACTAQATSSGAMPASSYSRGKTWGGCFSGSKPAFARKRVSQQCFQSSFAVGSRETCATQIVAVHRAPKQAANGTAKHNKRNCMK